MADPKDTKSFDAKRIGGAGAAEAALTLLGEEPLLIRIEDRDYAVVMRTPGEERAHAAGFCLAEGLIDHAAELRTIGHDRHDDPNIVHVWLTPERSAQIAPLLERKAFVSQTSCGICGKGMIEDLQQQVRPLDDDFRLPADQARAMLAQLDQQQRYYSLTRCSHAALLLDATGALVTFSEDVGRHNALDKAIGRALLDGTLDRVRVGVLSSRNSYELVQKAARARIPVLISNSRPTALAVEMARSLNLTLAFPDRPDGLLVATAPQRIEGA